MSGLTNIVASLLMSVTPAKNDIPAEQYLMDSTKTTQEKPKDQFKQYQEAFNPNKYGTGQRGLFEDADILKKADHNSKEYQDAVQRFTQQTYFQPNSSTDNPSVKPDSTNYSGNFPNNLGYQTMDDFMDDFNSNDFDIKFNQANKLFNEGQRTGDPEYYKLAIADYGWIIKNKKDQMKDNDYTIGLNLELMYQFFTKNNDFEAIKAIVKAQFMRQPESTTFQQRMHEYHISN